MRAGDQALKAVRARMLLVLRIMTWCRHCASREVRRTYQPMAWTRCASERGPQANAAGIGDLLFRHVTDAVVSQMIRAD